MWATGKLSRCCITDIINYDELHDMAFRVQRYNKESAKVIDRVCLGKASLNVRMLATPEEAGVIEWAYTQALYIASILLPSPS